MSILLLIFFSVVVFVFFSNKFVLKKRSIPTDFNCSEICSEKLFSEEISSIETSSIRNIIDCNDIKKNFDFFKNMSLFSPSNDTTQFPRCVATSLQDTDPKDFA